MVSHSSRARAELEATFGFLPLLSRFETGGGSASEQADRGWLGNASLPQSPLCLADHSAGPWEAAVPDPQIAQKFLLSRFPPGRRLSSGRRAGTMRRLIPLYTARLQ